MNSENGVASPRRPWVAAALNFIWPGVGHLYAGRGRVGLALLLLAPVVVAGISMLPLVIPVAVANVVIPVLLLLAMPTLFAWSAARAARKVDAARPRPVFSRWYMCLGAAILSGVLNLLYGPAAYVKGYACQGHAMEPTVLEGDRVWVAKAAGGWRDVLGIRAIRPSRGDVIVFRYPRDRSVVFIKRLMGLPAETVELRGEQVVVNGAPLNEPRAPFSSASRDSWGPKLVPAASYFVLGDNLDVSNDSRAWGFVPEGDLVGRAGIVYWSSEPRGGRVRWERIGTRLQ